MRDIRNLVKTMKSLGFEKFEEAGFDSFRNGERVVRFIWWENRTIAEKDGGPIAHLVVRELSRDKRITQRRQDGTVVPWSEIEEELLNLLREE